MGLEERKPVEAAKVRLVRCPKCENLLPELPDFPLYQCGGCGAVLKAKNIGFLEDGMSEISEAVKGVRISEEDSVRGCSKLGVNGSFGMESSKVDKIHNEKVVSDGFSTAGAENREVLSDSDTTGRGKERITRMEWTKDDYRSHALGLVGSINQGSNFDLGSNGVNYANCHGEQAMKEMKPPVELSRQWPVMDQLDVAVSHEPSNDVTAQPRPRNFLYHAEGPSNREMNSSYYEYGEKNGCQDQNLDGLARVKNLENDRAKLLRRLDELKDQISRSGDVVDKQKEMLDTDWRMDFPTPPHPYGRHRANYVQETYSHGVHKQPLRQYDTEPSYMNRTRSLTPCSDMYGSSYMGSYPHRGLPYEFLGNDDVHRTEIIRRPPFQLQSQYMHQPYHDKFHGYYGDVNHDHFMLHRHEDMFHQPACSFGQCYNKNWHMPSNADHPGFSNQGFRNESSDPNFHRSMKATQLGLQGFSSGGSSLYQLPSRQPKTVKFSDHDRPRNVMLAHRSGHVCRPVAGGAPFITCCNCFELLKLPQKCISSVKMQHKMKCGACSSTISFEVGDTGFIGSVSLHVDQVPTEIDNGSSGLMDENVIYWAGDSNSAEMNGCSNDYNELQAKFSATDKKSDSGGSDKPLEALSSNPSSLENGWDPEKAASRNHTSPSAELPPEETKSHVHLESSTKKYLNNCSDINAISQSDKGNKSKRSEKERVLLDRITSRQNSVTDAAMASEMDLPSNEFSNNYMSHDSEETSKEDHQKTHKGGDSFFAGLIKKSFKDFKKSSQSVEAAGSQVFVNGRAIPDRALKKAEKFAGPILPGEYWYDICAGFWGVMGHPCLGIIMPDIEEFNYPIPENCAAGNTGVFVNGRELHQKDLDLLTARGLPITRNQSYIIEISGKVTDEHTGEELDCLGKLAPTVERAKHGFGMKVPVDLA